MKKLLTITALFLTSTTFAFGGAGADRAGRIVNPDTHNVSHPANVIIRHGQGASQRLLRHDVKRATKLARTKTREQKSQLLDKRFFRGSYRRPELKITEAPLNWLEEIQAKLRAKRNNK